MGKNRIIRKQKKSKRKLLTVLDPLSHPILKDKTLTMKILHQCIDDGDVETFRDELTIYLRSVNKMEFVEEAGIGRRTLYDLLDPSKEFNPEFKTLCALFQALKAA
jgi:DNA-binding phage protein